MVKFRLTGSGDGNHVTTVIQYGRSVSDETSAYLMVIGDRDALSWVLSTQQTAFPVTRRDQVSHLEAGHELLVYTTRGCFGNPTRDKGRIIARAAVTGPTVHDEEPVRFGEREFPLRCPLRITDLAPFGEGVVLADHVETLHAFPNPKTWSVLLRRPPVPLDAHDHRYLTAQLDPVTKPITETLKGYTR